MPTKREREYYRMGFQDGLKDARRDIGQDFDRPVDTSYLIRSFDERKKKKRKLSAWNKFVKANSKKPRFRYARSNKINLKKMAVAFRKTPQGKKKRR